MATGGSRRKKLQEFDPFQQQPGQGVPGMVPGQVPGVVPGQVPGVVPGVPRSLGPYDKNRTGKDRCNRSVLVAFFILLLSWTIILPTLPRDGSCQISEL